MKVYVFGIAMLLSGCGNNGGEKSKTNSVDTTIFAPGDSVVEDSLNQPDSLPAAKMYFNERFRNVTVEKTGEEAYRVKGEAQIFEANFGWVVEDGHNELNIGNEMTEAGAPEWGRFDFTVRVKKERENSTLHLILFETSAKDGSRQYELPITLD